MVGWYYKTRQSTIYITMTLKLECITHRYKHVPGGLVALLVCITARKFPPPSLSADLVFSTPPGVGVNPLILCAGDQDLDL